MDMINLSVIRQSFGNVVYTHKIHEISAEAESKKSLIIKLANIGLVASVLIIIIFQISNPQHILWSYIGAGLTISEVIFLIIQLSFNFADKSSQHKKTALSLLNIREKYIGLMADIINDNLDVNEISKQRDELQNKLEIIYNFAPQTTTATFKKAQQRLNPKGAVEGEEFTFTDDEIDRFMPEKIRISNIKTTTKTNRINN